MSLTTYRTTFALDAATARRLKTLAARWHVSQAEVVRRAIELAEKSADEERPDPVAMLEALHAQGNGLNQKIGDSYLAQVRKDRQEWRKR